MGVGAPGAAELISLRWPLRPLLFLCGVLGPALGGPWVFQRRSFLCGGPGFWVPLCVVPVLFCMYLFACALALFASALQVFVRDVAQILPPLMTFWFFTTPILYPASVLPPGFAAVMQFNPMSWYVERLRDFLLFYRRSAGLAEGDFSGLRTAFESLASRTPAPWMRAGSRAGRRRAAMPTWRSRCRAA